ncbi:hypothetical protein TNCV_1367981 [Trichonephila clavipes]|nr:hypothetical protein TNCV_1367981 [Trichonephila clavipes]
MTTCLGVLSWNGCTTMKAGAAQVELEGQQIPCFNHFWVKSIQVATDELASNFWKLDSVPKISLLTSEEKAFEDHFMDTYVSNEAAGKPAYIDAIVVGSLWSWDPANDTVLLRLGISRKYAILMGKLICSDVIRWSRDIYIEPLTGKRQF